MATIVGTSWLSAENLAGETFELPIDIKMLLDSEEQLEQIQTKQAIKDELEMAVGKLCEKFNQDMKESLGKRPCYDKNFCADDFIVKTNSNDLNLSLAFAHDGYDNWVITLKAGIIFDTAKTQTLGFCWHPGLYPPLKQAEKLIDQY